MNRLAILGSYPPPYSGVTTHIERLCRVLDDRKIPYRVYNATSETGDGDRVVSVQKHRGRWLVRYALTGRESAALVFSDRLPVWVAGAVMTWRGRRVILRLRNVALHDYARGSWWRRRLSRYAIRKMWAVVCVNQDLLEEAVRLGVPRDRLLRCPGFIPPASAELDREGTDDAAWRFCAQHDPVIAANGKVNWYRGTDTYGLDHLVELVARLKPQFPRCGAVACLAGHGERDQPYLDELVRRAEALNVADDVLFLTRPGRFLPILAAANVFVRPTNTDGDANSIREALSLQVPAVASDAVERPVGTRVFPARDLAAFTDAVRAVLSERRPEEPRTAPASALPEEMDRYVALLANALHPTAPAPAG